MNDALDSLAFNGIIVKSRIHKTGPQTFNLEKRTWKEICESAESVSFLKRLRINEEVFEE